MSTFMPLALFFVLALGASPAPAADPTAATGPLAAMNFFIGTWNCTGGMLPQPARKATLTFEVELGGDIVQLSVDAPAAGKLPAYHSLASYAYDAKKHRLTESGMSAMGEWGVASSPGWVGNALTWTDVATYDNDLGREVVTKAGTTGYDDVAYSKVKGAWKASFRAHCVKATTP